MSNATSYRLLERTGLQYIVLENVSFDEKLLSESLAFCRARGTGKRIPVDKFFPQLIVPSMKGGEVVDSQGNPIAPDDLFEVQVLNAIDYFRDRWLPLPYPLFDRNSGSHEIESNDWVRLYYTRSHSQSIYGFKYDIVLCVDTQLAGSGTNGEFLPTVGQIREPANYPFRQERRVLEFDHIESMGGESRVRTENRQLHGRLPCVFPFSVLLKALGKILPSIEIVDAVGRTFGCAPVSGRRQFGEPAA